MIFKTNFPGADFWLIRKGSAKKLGTPVKEFSKEYIGVKVDEAVFVVGYAYYLFMYLHSLGAYRGFAKGTTNLQHITLEDCKLIFRKHFVKLGAGEQHRLKTRGGGY